VVMIMVVVYVCVCVCVFTIVCLKGNICSTISRRVAVLAVSFVQIVCQVFFYFDFLQIPVQTTQGDVSDAHLSLQHQQCWGCVPGYFARQLEPSPDDQQSFVVATDLVGGTKS
jgi:hypothetical protein